MLSYYLYPRLFLNQQNSSLPDKVPMRVSKGDLLYHMRGSPNPLCHFFFGSLWGTLVFSHDRHVDTIRCAQNSEASETSIGQEQSSLALDSESSPPIDVVFIPQNNCMVGASEEARAVHKGHPRHPGHDCD